MLTSRSSPTSASVPAPRWYRPRAAGLLTVFFRGKGEKKARRWLAQKRNQNRGALFVLFSVSCIHGDSIGFEEKREKTGKKKEVPRLGRPLGQTRALFFFVYSQIDALLGLIGALFCRPFAPYFSLFPPGASSRTRTRRPLSPLRLPLFFFFRCARRTARQKHLVPIEEKETA